MSVWLGWITMRGDDNAIDNVLTNPKRRTRLHLFTNLEDRTAACGVVRPTEDDHLGLVRENESPRCARCTRKARGQA